MQSFQNLNEPKFSSVYDKLTVLDLITLKLVLNYRKLVVGAFGFMILSLLSPPILKAAGLVSYIVCMALIAFIQWRFKNWWQAAVLTLVISFNILQIAILIF